MGIQGLIPFLKKASRRVNLREFSGCTAGIDAYCWLHKGAFGCAEKLGKGQVTDGYVQYCIKMINVLLSMRITPIMIFDGCRLPAKKGVELNRREQRERNKKKAKEFLREGKLKEAREHFQRSVDITSEMALELIKACQKIGVDCIVAPYEADAQLAYLNKEKIIQLVITEDSDLVLFGCDYILFKMDSMGFGVLIEKSRLHLCMDANPSKFLFEKFRYMCIMSGCDYLPSLPGIGLAKSCKFFIRVTNLDLNHTLARIPSYLRMPQLTVTEEYKNGFHRAINTYLYQLAFDPRSKKLVPINPYPDDVSPSDFDYAGPYFSNDVAYQLALGNINVQTMAKMANFDPNKDLVTRKTSSWADKNNKSMQIKSIWSSDFKRNAFDISKCPIEMKKSPSKGKEIVVHVSPKVFTVISHKKIEVVNENMEEDLTRFYASSPPKKRIRTEFSPEKSVDDEISPKLLLDRILSASKTTPSPNSDKTKADIPSRDRLTSKYFTPVTKKVEKISWFDEIASEYEQNAPKTEETSPTELENGGKSPEIGKNVRKSPQKVGKESPNKENITERTSSFAWKTLTTSTEFPVSQTPFKSPRFVRKFSLDSSQGSTNSSIVDNSIDNDSFDLSQSQNTEDEDGIEELDFPKKLYTCLIKHTNGKQLLNNLHIM
uniref:Exonuclease 1 n=1 Tax=Strigamia maritima TaxID=126957 RepID=T1J9L4_STRMM